MMVLFLKLLMGHAIADFGLQSQQMAKGKNRHVPKEYVPPGQPHQTIWPYYMTAHALIHGAAVMLITGSAILSLFESITHWMIDYGKCENEYGVHADQAMHVGILFLIAYLAVLQ